MASSITGIDVAENEALSARWILREPGTRDNETFEDPPRRRIGSQYRDLGRAGCPRGCDPGPTGLVTDRVCSPRRWEEGLAERECCRASGGSGSLGTVGGGDALASGYFLAIAWYATLLRGRMSDWSG